jgi:hypothetical protein
MKEKKKQLARILFDLNVKVHTHTHILVPLVGGRT